jgi:S1-C subfamily serine protease/Tfp pilus assembly protein PilF
MKYLEVKYLPIIGLIVAIVSCADLDTSNVPIDIESTAKAVTVEIKLSKSGAVGSGVIIDRQGDLYTLITNRHVVCGKIWNCSTPPLVETYTLSLDDGQKYQASAKSVKILGNNLDLAIVQFQSNSDYPVAQLAEPGSLKAGDAVYAAGHPAAAPGFYINAGNAIAVVNKRLTEDDGGYTIVYDAQTQPGMSGGGVFSQSGQLVAIHGQGLLYQDNTELQPVSSSGYVQKEEVGSKIGYNRGIPVQWAVQGLTARGIKLGNGQPVNSGQTAANSADEHFIAGLNKFVDPGADVIAGKRLAIGEFSQAIRINPDYTEAYIARAFTYSQLEEKQRAIADYDRVIALDPKYILAYSNRGNLKLELNDSQGALSDYDQAIALDSKDAIDYYNRGLLKKNKLNDPQGALADYDRAIELNPKFVDAYTNRGLLKKNKLNDPQGALADYDQAIAINPKFPLVYVNRGTLKQELNDRPAGIADMRQAAKLARAQGNSYILKAALETLQSWGVGE